MSMEDMAPKVPMEMDFHDAQGRVLVELRQMDPAQERPAIEAPELDKGSISLVNHWLGTVPSFTAAGSVHGKELLTCTVDFSNLVQATDGSGAIGSAYKAGTTEFAPGTRFHKAENIKSMVNASLIMNIASQVLAQKHLADINERLQAIEQQVKGIQEYLEKSRFSKIKTLQEHLQRLGKVLGQGEHVSPDSFKTLIGQVQDVRSEVVHLREDLEKAREQVRTFDSSSLFGSNHLRSALQQKIDRVSHLQREYLLGMQCLLMANLILFIKHGANKEFVLAGEDYLNELDSELDQWEITKRRVTFHLSKMKPLFELAKSTQANVLLLEGRVAKVQRLIVEDVEQVRQLQQRLVRAQRPCVLLELEHGQVARGHHLP